MPSLRLEDAYRALKRADTAPVYYLTGHADILKQELSLAIADAAVEAGARDFNVDIRSASDLDGEALHTLVETPPMLAARRAVVVRNLEQWRPNAGVWRLLFDYLEHPSTTTVLVLVHGSGEKPIDRIAARTVHVEIDALKPELLRRWVADHARKSGIELTPDAAEHLIDALGDDLASLSMEVAKIAAAVSSEAPVTVEQVSHLAGVRRGETITEWVEAILELHPRAAVSLLDAVLSQPGVNGVRMLTALGTALLGVRAARALHDAGATSKQMTDQLFQFLQKVRPQGLGRWSEETRRWTRAAALWTGDEVERALAEVIQADRALKSTSLTDERGVLANLLVRFGRSPSPVENGAAA